MSDEKTGQGACNKRILLMCCNVMFSISISETINLSQVLTAGIRLRERGQFCQQKEPKAVERKNQGLLKNPNCISFKDRNYWHKIQTLLLDSMQQVFTTMKMNHQYTK